MCGRLIIYQNQKITNNNIKFLWKWIISEILWERTISNFDGVYLKYMIHEVISIGMWLF